MQRYKLELDKAIMSVKINISLEEREELAGELTKLIDWLQPLISAATGDAREKLFNHGEVNVWREDSPEQGDRAKMQKTASTIEEGLYSVPTIIE